MALNREDKPSNAPVLVFVHGGGWILGFKEFQALPMLNRMAAEGWVCISIDYRLSPKATFPDHIADVNRGIVWAKAHAHQWGGDPSFVAISGNSAGGHLAALAALTWDEPGFKPGLQVVHADDALLVFDKPAGLLAVPGRGEDKQDCLADTRRSSVRSHARSGVPGAAAAPATPPATPPAIPPAYSAVTSASPASARSTNPPETRCAGKTMPSRCSTRSA